MKNITGKGMSIPQCNTCKHKLSGRSCEAFDVIPIEILTNAVKHSKKALNQKGDYVYTRK